jgi:hypothetical protein
VSKIEDYAFGHCKALSEIKIDAIEPPQLGVDVFLETSNRIFLYVPNGSVASYKERAQWKTFSIYTTNGVHY